MLLVSALWGYYPHPTLFVTSLGQPTHYQPREPESVVPCLDLLLIREVQSYWYPDRPYFHLPLNLPVAGGSLVALRDLHPVLPVA